MVENIAKTDQETSEVPSEKLLQLTPYEYY